MNKRLYFLATVLAVSSLAACAGERCFEIHLRYENRSLLATRVEVKPLEEAIPDSSGDFTFQILDGDGEQLYRTSFDFPGYICWDGLDEEGRMTGGRDLVDPQDLVLRLPYFGKAEKMLVTHSGGIPELSIDLSEEKLK